MATKKTNKSKAKVDSKRDARGRFAPGNKFGTLPRIAQSSVAYLRQARLEVPPEEYSYVVRELLTRVPQMSDGNLIRAVGFLSQLYVGGMANVGSLDSSFHDLFASTSDNEYRVAGASRAEVAAEVVERLQRLMREKEEHEAMRSRFPHDNPERN